MSGCGHYAAHICRGDVSLLSVWKSGLEMFVHNKSKLNPSHEYSLVVLTDQANWVGHIHTVMYTLLYILLLILYTSYIHTLYTIIYTIHISII